jgi:3-oxoadipate enol-lactonase
MPYSTHKGVKTYYEVAGEGPPMVLLHATPWDHTMWLYQIAHFSTWFRVIAIDTRSFGRSDVVKTQFTFDDVVEETAALCDKEKVKDAVVMGCSLGHRIGYCLGYHRPDLVKAMVLVGGNAQAGGGSDSDKRREERIRRYREWPIEKVYDWQLRSTLSDAWQQTPIGAYVVANMLEKTPRISGLARALISESAAKKDLVPLLADIKMPVLVVSGEHDRSIPGAKDAASRMPQGKHVILPDTGHACCVEDPKGFDDLVIDFLKANSAMPNLS